MSVFFIARAVSSSTEYRGQIRIAPSRTVYLRAARLVSGSQTTLGSEVAVSGLTHTANSYIWLRGQVVGTNPTTIRLKAWAAGQAEPASWLYTATDSTSSLQTAGAFGLRAFLTSGVTNAPVTFSFDDFLVTSPSSTSTSLPPTPTSPPSGGTTFASDPFTRIITNGWGSANIGGRYTLSGSSSNFDVDGSVGTIVIPAGGRARLASLENVSAQDVDFKFRLKTDKLAAGTNQSAYFIARGVSSGTRYRCQIRISTSKTVHLRAIRVVGGSQTNLGSEVQVTGLTHVAGSYIWVRGQVVGTNPTAIRIKAWAAGQAEPSSWQYTVNDANASLQAAGSVGLRAFLPSAVTNAPVTFSFDDFLVTSP